MAFENTTLSMPRKQSFNWQAYMAVSLTVTVIIAVGNILTILAIWKNENLRTIPNKFIANLAVSDLLIAIQIIPHAVSRIPNSVYSSKFACLSATIIVDTSFRMSLMTVVLIALDRYLYICHPLRYHLLISVRKANVIIVSSWAIVSVYSSSLLFWNTMNAAGSRCSFHHVIPMWFHLINYVYSVALSIVMLVLYGTIIRVAVKQRTKVADVGRATKRALSVSDFRFLKMIIFVVGLLSLSWLPFNVLVLVDLIAKTRYRDRAAMYLEFLSYFSSAANFFVYAARDKDFMHAYKSLLSLKCHN